MPFKSEKQREYMYKNLPDIAKRWEEETTKDKVLPKRVESKPKQTKSLINTHGFFK